MFAKIPSKQPPECQKQVRNGWQDSQQAARYVCFIKCFTPQSTINQNICQESQQAKRLVCSLYFFNVPVNGQIVQTTSTMFAKIRSKRHRQTIRFVCLLRCCTPQSIIRVSKTGPKYLPRVSASGTDRQITLFVGLKALRPSKQFSVMLG